MRQSLKYSFSSLKSRLKAFTALDFLSGLFAVILFLCLGAFLRSIELENDHTVRITVNVKLERNVYLQLFYLPESESEYQEKYVINENIIGKSTYQSITFEIPDSTNVKQLRFDPGQDTLLRSFEMKSIVLSYNNHHVPLFNSSGNSNYFAPNGFIRQTEKERFEFIPGAHYDPSFYSQDLLPEYIQLKERKKKIPFAYLMSFVLVLGLWVYALFFVKRTSFITKFYAFASCFFVILLLLPFLNETFNLYPNENQEQRVLAKEPFLSSDSLLNYPSRFEKYYNDNFGFRDILVKLGGKIKYHVFNSSFIPEKTMVGKDGWLFLSGVFYRITRDLTRGNLYTKDELVQTVEEWERRKRLLNKDSIFYYRSFCPDKHYIYPEYLPFAMKIISKDTILRCDQAINYLKEKGSDLKIIDLRPALIEGKKTNQLYQKYDSHWNSYGAFLGYTELMKTISIDFPGLKPFPLSDFDVSWNEEGGGDLANTLGIKEVEMKPRFIFKRTSVQSTEMPVDGFPAKTIIYENKGAATSLTLLMHRDSFTNGMLQFLNLHFSKVILLWDAPYTDDRAKKVNADLVVETVASRYF